MVSCHNSSKKETAAAPPLFTILPSEKTHIDFANTLTSGANTNVLMYEYFYNGGGVAVGDVNGDGLEDIYFSANMASNRLYLNKGQMQFEDITEEAGVGARNGPWKTGITMADVNGDGLLDIFVCYSGNLRLEKLKSELYINQGADQKGIPHFIEKAQEYGLANPANSTQALFFDYDKDDDLDLFLLNHNPQTLPPVDETSIAAMLKTEDTVAGIRLFRNYKDVGGMLHFKDVTQKAGLHSSPLTYGLGAGIADINGDGWQDIYVSNDYIAPDYLYINNKNGTFSDKLANSIGHTSHFSMGNDIADINNDGLPDIFTADMLPEDNHRQKLLFAPDNYEKFDLNIRAGFHHQYMRNMLQVNNGDGSFSETAQAAGISNTDWSWAPLFADYDNDGWKDLFVTNGYLHDFTNQDFIKYMNDYVSRSEGNLRDENILELVNNMPSSDVINYFFKNNGNLTFSDVSAQWQTGVPSASNGAAYADLDNDGDLDIIVNNINKPAFIFQNEENTQLKHHYLKIKLLGKGGNTQGLGAKIWIWQKGKQQYLEQMPSRGFQSTVSPVLHFGLGTEIMIDSLRIVWPTGKQQALTVLKGDQQITLEEKKAAPEYKAAKVVTPSFTEVSSPVKFKQAANNINDFKRQPLLVHPMSFFGPVLAKGDVNGDGLEDVYAGGGSGQPASLYIQQKGGTFIQRKQSAFEEDRQSEDADAVFFDADGDNFTDLYVASGGYHNYTSEDALMQDRLYINDGKGNFSKAANALPKMLVSKSCVRITDFNGDGHKDIFTGGRVIPGQYPEIPRSYLLINDGKGNFKDETTFLAPQLQKTGMITDAAWIDLNGDNKQDLVAAGEWMPITIFINANGKLHDKTKDYFDKPYNGWWNKLLAEDMNRDGKPDLVIGNEGLNTQCKVSDKEPAELYFKDFDENGSIDPVLCFYMQGKSYPYVTRDELLDQMSIMRTRFADYKSYADANLKDIFTSEELNNVRHLKANYLKTAYFEMGEDGKFHEKMLPLHAQNSPVFTITSLDYDNDGRKDLLLCGNINHARLRFGKSDANYGTLLKGDGKGGFSYIPQKQSGFHLTGDIRNVLPLNNILLFGINQQEIKAYKPNVIK